MSMSSITSPKVLAIAVVGLLGAGAGVWGLTRARHDESKGPAVPQELTVDALKKAEPKQAMDALRKATENNDLTDEQRAEIGRNMRKVMEERMKHNVDEYFASPDSSRDDVLDKHIDEMQKFMKEREQAQQDSKETPEQRAERMKKFWGRDASPAQRKAASESRKPDDMARMMSYFGAMRKRMEKRGIEPPRWGGPGGGRGGPPRS